MSRFSPTTIALCLAAACGALALSVGCQTYEFEPVNVLGLSQTTQTINVRQKGLTPNVMFVVDRSGSMTLPFVVTPSCYGGPGGTTLCGKSQNFLCDPIACPSRWYTLTTTLSDFLSHHPAIARMGIAFFPQVQSDPGCGPAQSLAVPLATSEDAGVPEAHAADIQNALFAVKESGSPVKGNVGGGTPTGESLKFVAANGNFDAAGARGSYMLLLTDGLPNCNPDNTQNYNQDPATCACVDSPGVCQAYPVLACTDTTGTSQKIADIAKNLNVKTIVVGYGDVTGTAATQTLQAMGTAGQFNRQCHADGTECDVADVACLQGGAGTRPCDQQFFRVADQTQLAQALTAISGALPQSGDPCQLDLASAQPDPRLLSVVVTDNGVTMTYPYKTTPDAIWTQTSPTSLQFLGSFCDGLRSQKDNVNIVVRVAKTL